MNLITNDITNEMNQQKSWINMMVEHAIDSGSISDEEDLKAEIRHHIDIALANFKGELCAMFHNIEDLKEHLREHQSQKNAI